MAIDTAGSLAWQSPEGERYVLTTATGYECWVRAVGAGDQVWPALGLVGRFQFSQGIRLGGGLALGDLRGNGRRALFVAGGATAGRLSARGSSQVLEWRNGTWMVISSVVLPWRSWAL
ncbi:MAG: hypothetical protein M2R45_04482 [Verrucomicrobia subdivision 3 bacterium]|nr:hypothetical protein [Limisphaerales bacterium]MCS1412674.1 hypothetical protein [Limisphaerales bacterium]